MMGMMQQLIKEILGRPRHECRRLKPRPRRILQLEPVGATQRLQRGRNVRSRAQHYFHQRRKFSLGEAWPFPHVKARRLQTLRIEPGHTQDYEPRIIRSADTRNLTGMAGRAGSLEPADQHFAAVGRRFVATGAVFWRERVHRRVDEMGE